MSIHDDIKRLCDTGALQPYRPPTRRPPRRRLYLGPEARKDLNNPQSAICLLVGRGYVEAAMTRWVSGGWVNSAFLCRLEAPPPEIWEIRVTEPTVRARLFGRFAGLDTFILTQMRTRGLLKKKGSAAWATAMQSCERTWQHLFPNHLPHAGTWMRDYITENFDDYQL